MLQAEFLDWRSEGSNAPAGGRTPKARFARGFGVALGVFLATAAAGAAISFDRREALARLGLVFAGAALAAVVSVVKPGRLARFYALLPALVIVYFLLTADWTARIGKVQWLDPLLRWLASWQPRLPGARLDSNALGGVLAACLPLQWAALAGDDRRPSRMGWTLLALSAVCLLLSESRGAWLALAGAGALFVFWDLVRRVAGGNRLVQASLFGAALALVLLAGAGILDSDTGRGLLHLRSDRINVWRNSLDLARDYPFTGVGLGGFEMAYSSYVLLVHVGHTVHAHNLFLDLWLEQGAAGLVVFVVLVSTVLWMPVRAWWRGSPDSPWTAAALVSVVVVLLHGTVDDPFYGYHGRAISFLLLPFGVLAGSVGVTGRRRTFSVRTIGIAAGAVVVIAALPFLSAANRALVHLNLGALAQTRAELSVYRRPEWPIQDALRRSGKIDLAPAIAHYRAAMELDPSNAAANRRLGQIELSLGRYDDAREDLVIAFAAAPRQRATRQMLGELRAMEGDVEGARMLWEQTEFGAGQLALRQWWYDSLGELEHARLIRQAMPRK